MWYCIHSFSQNGFRFYKYVGHDWYEKNIILRGENLLHLTDYKLSCQNIVINTKLIVTKLIKENKSNDALCHPSW